MKKNLVLSIFFLMSFFLNLGLVAKEVEVDSKITEVMVYPDSAAVSRRASIKLKPGEYSVVFSGIVPEIDENSIRASISSGAQAVLFGAQLKRRHIEEDASPRVQEIKTRIQELEDKIKEQDNLKSLLLEKKKFIDSVRLFSQQQIPKDLVTKTPDTRELEELLKFVDTNLGLIYAQEREADLNIRDLFAKANVLREELRQISGPARKLFREITVDLKVLREDRFDIDIYYLTPGASWRPLYDARVNFEKSEAELVSYGIVRQQTGEDWENINISLSTARAAAGGVMPELSSWLIRQYQPPLTKRPAAPSKMQLLQELSVDNFASKAEASWEIPVWAAAEEKGIAVTYSIARSVTVKSDGSEHRFPVWSQPLTADFEYSAYPRAVSEAFLRSKVDNAKDLQILSGRVNIFLDADFVGSSSIADIGPGEKFDLYLGMDKNVKVKREQIEKKVDDILFGGIPSPNIKTTLRYKLTVENYKTKPVKMIIFDSLPVSQDEKIKVRIINVSIEPAEKDWEDKLGVWRWEFNLDPGQKREIFYTVVVEHSRNIRVDGI